MANIRPDNLILRCYGYRSRKGSYTGVCIDLNIAVQANSPEELKRKMSDALTSYLDAVLDTDNKESIPYLIRRRAPLRDWLYYYFIKAVVFIREFPGNFTFQEYIPFHLAHNN